MLLLADAIERADRADRAAITAALESSTFADHFMPYGPTKFVNGQNTGAAPLMTQVLKNDIKVDRCRANSPTRSRSSRCRRTPPACRRRRRRALDLGILVLAVLNGLTTGAVYALVALGLTLIYGVLHIINFAHGALLMLALFAVFFAQQKARARSLPRGLAAGAGIFALGYVLQRFVINRAAMATTRTSCW